MEKIGYKVIIKSPYYQVQLVEVIVVGDSVKNMFHREEWPSKERKVIWASDLKNLGESRREPRWEENLVFSLDEVRQQVIDAVVRRKEALERQIYLLGEVRNTLSQIDLDTIPKDEYVSPFTGKKT